MSASPGVALVVHLRDAEGAARCLRALAQSPWPGAPVLAGGTPEGHEVLERLSGGLGATWLPAAGAALVNAAAEASGTADLLLLDGASEVGSGWAETFQAVAAAEPDAATITALSNDAALLSVPRRNLPWPLPPSGLTPQQAAQRVRDGALGIHPHTPTALPHAVLIRSAALQLVGPLDEALPLADALADFSARCTAAGLANLVADELFVAHRGAPPAGPWEGGAAAERHPALAPAIRGAAEDRHSALARALLAASVTLDRLTVTVDARNVAGGVTGSVVHVVELLGALATRDDVRVRAVLPAQVGDEAGRALARMPAVERLSAAAAEAGEAPRTHIAHRPWQVESLEDMALLDRLGERTVLTHQDLIGYRTPAVFASVERWRDYRRTTVDALGVAAMVLFFSAAAAADAAADDLVATERRRVVALGAAPVHLRSAAAPTAPAAVEERERPFLLVLGTRFRHKNVRFALDLLAALREEHGWDGELVIAGADVLHGSGSSDDAAWQLAHPAHAEHVIELGAVAEAEKAWLLGHAAAVVYPSTYEGFGLIPFEAAAAGTPCLLAPVSALRDGIPDHLALLTPWDAAASAQRAARVLGDGPERTALVEGLRETAAALTWDATGEALVGAYRAAVALPAPPAARLVADLARAEHDYWTVRDGVPEDVWTLVRPDAPQIDPPLARQLSAVLTAQGRRRMRLALRACRRLARED